MVNNMNIKEAKQEIKNTVRAYLLKNESGEYEIPSIRQRPILLMGPPGIGKTQIMEQVARECRVGLVSYTITHHTRQSAVGLPFIREEEYGGKTCSVTEYTMSEIIASVYEKMKESGLQEGILFIDEINCVSETLAPTMLQFLQCKTFGNQEIPKGWIIVAAGNPPEYNKSVREFDMVTLDRVRKIEITPDLTVWKNYARASHIDNAILSYLDLKPQNFYRTETDVDGMHFVTARGWEDFSNLLHTYEKLGIPMEEKIILEFLQHEDVAQDVAAYLDLYEKYKDQYGIKEILQGKVKSDAYASIYKASFDERLSVVNLLLSGLNNYFQKVTKEKYITDTWFAFLKQFRTELERANDIAPVYQEMLEEKEQLLQQEKNGGLYTREELHLQKVCIALLHENKPDQLSNVEEAFESARAGFDVQREKLEAAEDEAMQALEHAFDFVEQAFEGGQELVVFVTELTLNPDSAAFLGENECERYFKYNKELLVVSRRAELLSELEVGNIRSKEHIREL